MPSPSPWSIKNIPPEMRRQALAAARRNNQTLGAWLSERIAEAAEETPSETLGETGLLEARPVRRDEETSTREQVVAPPAPSARKATKRRKSGDTNARAVVDGSQTRNAPPRGASEVIAPPPTDRSADDLAKALKSIAALLGEVEERKAAERRIVDGVETRLAGLEAAISAVPAQIDALRADVHERLSDGLTGPRIDALDASFAELASRAEASDRRAAETEARLGDIREAIEHVSAGLMETKSAAEQALEEAQRTAEREAAVDPASLGEMVRAIVRETVGETAPQASDMEPRRPVAGEKTDAGADGAQVADSTFILRDPIALEEQGPDVAASARLYEVGRVQDERPQDATGVEALESGEPEELGDADPQAPIDAAFESAPAAHDVDGLDAGREVSNSEAADPHEGLETRPETAEKPASDPLLDIIETARADQAARGDTLSRLAKRATASSSPWADVELDDQAPGDGPSTEGGAALAAFAEEALRGAPGGGRDDSPESGSAEAWSSQNAVSEARRALRDATTESPEALLAALDDAEPAFGAARESDWPRRRSETPDAAGDGADAPLFDGRSTAATQDDAVARELAALSRDLAEERAVVAAEGAASEIRDDTLETARFDKEAPAARPERNGAYAAFDDAAFQREVDAESDARAERWDDEDAAREDLDAARADAEAVRESEAIDEETIAPEAFDGRPSADAADAQRAPREEARFGDETEGVARAPAGFEVEPLDSSDRDAPPFDARAAMRSAFEKADEADHAASSGASAVSAFRAARARRMALDNAADEQAETLAEEAPRPASRWTRRGRDRAVLSPETAFEDDDEGFEAVELERGEGGAARLGVVLALGLLAATAAATAVYLFYLGA